ncbi:MAG: M23 family metallopeptidase [Myxococcales bacterium]|nr:M23 family metallopeptidase [Myxococcales bacterium]
MRSTSDDVQTLSPAALAVLALASGVSVISGCGSRPETTRATLAPPPAEAASLELERSVSSTSALLMAGALCPDEARSRADGLRLARDKVFESGQSGQSGAALPIRLLRESAALIFDLEVVRRRGCARSSLAAPVPRDGWPLRSIRLTSGFGERADPIDGDVRFHAGVDLAGLRGDPVLAFRAGQVTTVATAQDGCGLRIVVSHDAGFSSEYCHLDTADVAPGQRVEVGTPIGTVGDSGRTTGPHLHFGVRLDGSPIDPLSLLVVTADDDVKGNP